MVDFPSTDNVTVAQIAAAMELASHRHNSASGETLFIPRLERFLVAYKAISGAVQKATNGYDINVKTIMEEVKTTLGHSPREEG